MRPSLARPVSRLLPLAELAVAAALLWPSTSVVGAAGGLFLLVLSPAWWPSTCGGAAVPPAIVSARWVGDAPISAAPSCGTWP